MIDRRYPAVYFFVIGDVDMPGWGILLVFFGTFLVFALLHAVAKNKRPFSRSLLIIAIGLGTLSAVNLSTGLTGVSIPVSLLSVLTAAVGGVPGVTLILALNLFF